MQLREPDLLPPTSWIYFMDRSGQRLIKIEIPRAIYFAHNHVLAIQHVVDNNLLPTPASAWVYANMMTGDKLSFDTGTEDYRLLPGDAYHDNDGYTEIVLPARGELVTITPKPGNMVFRGPTGRLSLLGTHPLFNLVDGNLEEK